MQNEVLFNLIKQQQSILDQLNVEIERRNISWKTLARNGLTVKAIIKYRMQNNTSYTEARDAVRDYQKKIQES